MKGVEWSRAQEKELTGKFVSDCGIKVNLLVVEEFSYSYFEWFWKFSRWKSWEFKENKGGKEERRGDNMGWDGMEKLAFANPYYLLCNSANCSWALSIVDWLAAEPWHMQTYTQLAAYQISTHACQDGKNICFDFFRSLKAIFQLDPRLYLIRSTGIVLRWDTFPCLLSQGSKNWIKNLSKLWLCIGL